MWKPERLMHLFYGSSFCVYVPLVNTGDQHWQIYLKCLQNSWHLPSDALPENTFRLWCCVHCGQSSGWLKNPPRWLVLSETSVCFWVTDTEALPLPNATSESTSANTAGQSVQANHFVMALYLLGPSESSPTALRVTWYSWMPSLAVPPPHTRSHLRMASAGTFLPATPVSLCRAASDRRQYLWMETILSLSSRLNHLWQNTCSSYWLGTLLRGDQAVKWRELPSKKQN